MGFCLFSTVAIAARHVQRRGCRRVMIFDFDVRCCCCGRGGLLPRACSVHNIFLQSRLSMHCERLLAALS